MKHLSHFNENADIGVGTLDCNLNSVFFAALLKNIPNYFGDCFSDDAAVLRLGLVYFFGMLFSFH